MITINFNRKNRYFIIFFTLRNLQLPGVPAQKGDAPAHPLEAKKEPATGPVPPHLESWLNIMIKPEKGKPAPHVGMKQALSMIHEKFPAHNSLAITGIKELSKKDFEDWTNG